MQFASKLDFIMNLTSTTNSALALHTSLDPSHISRLRSGMRKLSKKETYLKNMASYFSRHCVESYQRRALFDALKIKTPITDDLKLSELILQWFRNENDDESKTVVSFLDDLSNLRTRGFLPDAGNSLSAPEKPPTTEATLFYGIDGKRQAAVQFLTEVVEHDTPQTLLLFSDEGTDWMKANTEFAQRWAVLMSQILSRGIRIKIIHTVSRDLDEMLGAIGQWLPLYMSGAIEPYYYPKKRDGVFKRTLFIAPETSAVVSTSVGGMIRQAANIYFRDKKTVESFEAEFNQYLNLCKPLMRIFTLRDEESYIETLTEFEKEKSDTILKTESLSILTMPDPLFRKIIGRHETRNTYFLDYYQSRSHIFEKTLQTNSFTEILQLPDIESVKSGKIRVSFSDMLSRNVIYYTAEEYITHLENIVSLLKTHTRFHVYITDEIRDDKYMLYSKEDLGLFVAKTTYPPMILAINENNITAAFWDYLKNIIGKSCDEPDNGETIAKLNRYIGQLKESL